MCLYPRLIQNQKYLSNKKNGGLIPPIYDKRVLHVPIGCGECIECRKQKARGWQIRLLEDIKTNKNGKFITLTFSNKSIKELNNEIPRIKKTTNKRSGKLKIILLKDYERDNAIATLAIRRFLERWRKEHKKSPRHWLVTELGHKGTENIHIHGIIWTDKLLDIQKHWKYGFIWKGYNINGKIQNYVNNQTVNYIIKYVNKIDLQHKLYKSKVLSSSGIGNNYTNTYNSNKNKYNGTETDETYRTNTGHHIAIPIYYRNKIYSDEEREELWLNKLDKNERWICGERVDISKTEKNYYKILQFHKERNTQLGYGNGKINWKRKEYEEQRRKIMQETRIKDTKLII